MGAASSVDDGRGDPFVTVEEMKGVPDVAWRDFIENFDGLDAAAKLPREVVLSQAMAWKEDTQLGAALTSAKTSGRWEDETFVGSTALGNRSNMNSNFSGEQHENGGGTHADASWLWPEELAEAAGSICSLFANNTDPLPTDVLQVCPAFPSLPSDRAFPSRLGHPVTV